MSTTQLAGPIVIAGGSGFLGVSLALHLKDGFEFRIPELGGALADLFAPSR